MFVLSGMESSFQVDEPLQKPLDLTGIKPDRYSNLFPVVHNSL
jgi:hypothetical protein